MDPVSRSATLRVVLPILLTLAAAPLAAQDPVEESTPTTVRLPAGKQPFGDRELHMYDVRDLVPPEAAARDAGPEIELGEDEAASVKAKPYVEGLAGYVRLFAEPALARDEDVKTFREGVLVVLASPQTHAWITRFLARQRAMGEHMFDVEARFLLVDPASFREHVAPLLVGDEQTAPAAPAGEEGTAVSSAILAAGAETERFVKALTTAAAVQSLVAPRLLVNPWQRASMSAMEHTSYIRDFHVEEVDGGVIADPVVDVLRTGFFLESQLASLPSGAIGLDVSFRQLELLEMPRRQLDLAERDARLKDAAAAKVWIQLPKIRTSRVDTRVVLPTGATVLFALPPRQAAAKGEGQPPRTVHEVVLVRARTIKPR